MREEPAVPKTELLDIGPAELQRLVNCAAFADLGGEPERRVARRDAGLVRAPEPDLNGVRDFEPRFADGQDGPGMGIIADAGGEAADGAVDRCVAIGADDHGSGPAETVPKRDMVGIAVSAVE